MRPHYYVEQLDVNVIDEGQVAAELTLWGVYCRCFDILICAFGDRAHAEQYALSLSADDCLPCAKKERGQRALFAPNANDSGPSSK